MFSPENGKSMAARHHQPGELSQALCLLARRVAMSERKAYNPLMKMAFSENPGSNPRFFPAPRPGLRAVQVFPTGQIGTRTAAGATTGSATRK